MRGTRQQAAKRIKRIKRACGFVAERLEERTLLSTIYVDAGVTTGDADGSSWANAYQDLQQALWFVSSGDKILVAGGTYRPTSGTNRTIFFMLKNGVEIDGGYAGNASPSNPDARDITAYESILSGDIGVAGDSSDNSFHVVVGSFVDTTAVLDGFTITGGNANAGFGGGMYNTRSRATLINCTFTGNTSSTYGGGMYNSDDSSPSLTNCTFSGNSAFFGGGMYTGSMSAKDISSPKLTNCTFSGNSASSSGGGIYSWHSPFMTLTNCTFSGDSSFVGGGMFTKDDFSLTLTNCTFNANSASSAGGGMFNDSGAPKLTDCTFSGNSASHSGGGMYSYESDSPLTLTNCTFSGNSASSYGGGMFNSQNSPTLTNCTFSANTATAGFGSGGMYNDGSTSPTLTNCIVWGSGSLPIYDGTSTITYSDIEGGHAGTGNINADPKFIREPSPGADGKWGTADDDYGDLRLQLTSPCIDAGNNLAVPSGVTTDLAGSPRFEDVPSVIDTGAGTPPIVDMGAYETLVANLTGSYLGVVPTQVLAQGQLGVLRNYSVSGAGNSYFFIQYRLSANTVWGNADDVPIAEYDAIGPVDSSIGPHSAVSKLTVPAGAKPGTYYLLAKVDSTNVVAETNENDNVIVGNQIQVMAMAQDAFAYATPISGATASLTGTNVNATKEAGEPWHAGYQGGHSVWWNWTAPDSGRVWIDTTGSSFDTLLEVYVGSDVSKLSYVAHNDNLGSGYNTSGLGFNATRGVTYRIAVDGKSGATGSIKLNVTQSPGVLDDEQAAFSGSWYTMNGSFQGSMRYALPGTGSSTATWTFNNIAAGTYQVSTTWLALSNVATNAPFSVYDGTRLLGTVAVNQKLTPSGSSYDGLTWQILGSSFTISSGTLTVKLSNKANAYVLADAVRIEKIG